MGQRLALDISEIAGGESPPLPTFGRGLHRGLLYAELAIFRKPSRSGMPPMLKGPFDASVDVTAADWRNCD
jgi:hypothetical protein